jgi:hypothetical protein
VSPIQPGLEPGEVEKGAPGQPAAVPHGLHVPAHSPRVRDLEITDCDFKLGGVRRATPYAFTEQGVAMLSSVLRSPRAIAVNVEIMRAFVRLRRAAASVAELGRKIDALERRYDGQFRVVFDAIRELMLPPEPERRRIGFRASARRAPA